MRAIEFDANIEDGAVKIPQEYSLPENHRVRIILLTKDGTDELIDVQSKMKAIIDEMSDRDVFDKIDDPVEWQKQQREEWDERAA